MEDRPLSHVLRGTVLAIVESARRIRGDGRVLGLRALESPDLAESMRNQHGETIVVCWCPSALAVWDAIHNWDGCGWLVILTDQDEEDLGSGTMALFVEHRLRTTDPWETVKQRFGAATLHRDLAGQGNSELAQGLIRAEPVVAVNNHGGWPKVRSGVLTKDSVFSAVAERRLGLTDSVLDGPAVLEWTGFSTTVKLVGELRHLAGDSLTSATLQWLAGRTGEAALVTEYLMAEGRFDDIFALGVAADHLDLGSQTEPETELAWARLEHWYGPPGVSREPVAALGRLADETIRSVIQRGRSVRRWVLAILEKAEDLLRGAHAEHLVVRSNLLAGGLRARQRHLTDHLGDDPAEVEETWIDIDTHLLTNLAASEDDEKTYWALLAAVRLDRWLRSKPVAHQGDQVAQAAGMALEFARDTAWADACLTTILRGVPDPYVAERLRELSARYVQRRRSQDRAFAAVLEPVARGDRPDSVHHDGIYCLEDVLEHLILPLARSNTPHAPDGAGGMLILLLDGMDASAATQIVTGIQRIHRTWIELVPTSTSQRVAGLALLPSLTTHSRASFFAGRPMTGGQEAENGGFAAAVERAGLSSPVLFHKHDLDARSHGHELSEPVRDAIASNSMLPVVSCVLNTIDDSLDRSDPGGTDWSADSIKYLRPLLEAAASAGRTVVLTSDHGHVLERGGTLRSIRTATSARSRTTEGGPAGDDEVMVSGSRVLGGGNAILAVDADLRYTNKKAGYHGGASLAEIVVPIVVLSPPGAGGISAGAQLDGWEEAPSQEPLWWNAAMDDGRIKPNLAPAFASAEPYAPVEGEQTPSLFDDLELAEPNGSTSPTVDSGLGTQVTSTKTFASQEALAPRNRLESAKLAEFIDILASARGNRLPLATVSGVLGLAPSRLPGALAVITQLLNVEGYSVLTRNGDLVLLDVPMLKRQFGMN